VRKEEKVKLWLSMKGRESIHIHISLPCVDKHPKKELLYIKKIEGSVAEFV